MGRYRNWTFEEWATGSPGGAHAIMGRREKTWKTRVRPFERHGLRLVRALSLASLITPLRSGRCLWRLRPPDKAQVGRDPRRNLPTQSMKSPINLAKPYRATPAGRPFAGPSATGATQSQSRRRHSTADTTSAKAQPPCLIDGFIRGGVRPGGWVDDEPRPASQ